MPYTVPTPAEFRARFPGKFDAPGVSDAQVTYALERAQRNVDQSWAEGDYREGLMLYAAAFLTTQGLGVLPTGAAEGLAGISRVRSGALDVSFKDAASAGGTDPVLAVSPYGTLFAALRRQNRGGPLATSTGYAVGSGWPVLGSLPEG